MQGVAHDEQRKDDQTLLALGAAVKEDATVEDAPDAPEAGVRQQGVGGGAGEEGEGEVGGADDCAGGGRRGVRREGPAEAVPVHETDEGRRVASAETS